MLVYNSKDYHYYNKILNFVDLFPDCKKNRINEVNNDYFKNFVFDLMWIYKREMKKTNNSIMKSFYSGKINAMYYVLDRLPINPDYKLNDNKVFDYDKLIKILDKKLESILIEADDEMNFYYYNAVKKIGKYFAYKEIIKVSNFFKNKLEIENENKN